MGPVTLLLATAAARHVSPPAAPVDRPADSPCVTWQHQESCFCGTASPSGWSGMNSSAFVPSIYTAWRWFPNGTAKTGKDSYCAACLTPPSEHEFHCAYEFPCYVSKQGWGHHHLSSSPHFCIKNGCNVSYFGPFSLHFYAILNDLLDSSFAYMYIHVPVPGPPARGCGRRELREHM